MENDDGSHDFRTKIGGVSYFSRTPNKCFVGDHHIGRNLVENDRHPPHGSLGAEATSTESTSHFVSAGFFLCGYGSIPINTMFSGMNIHKSQLFWCELQGYKVLTHCHVWLILLILSIARVDNMILWSALVWFEDVRMMKHHNYCGHYPHNGQCSTIGFHHFIQICRVDSIRLH